MGLLRKRTQDISREDQKYLGRTSDPMDLQIVSASGCRLVDAKRREYIDLTSGWCVGNLGWNHPKVVKRVRDFDGPSYVQPALLYQPWVELAKRLVELAPGKLARAYRAVGGTEAVEQALQLAIAATGRTKLVAVEGAYHGNSLGAKSIGEGSELAVPHCKHIATPLDAKAVDRLETLLEHRDVAAFILEPVIVNLAVEVPTDEFLHGARALCDRYGTLLIFDEVASGFGRTGKLFAAEHAGVAPDIMALGKAIGNGHAPIAATLATRDVSDAVELHFYSTFGWLPLAVEAALGTLDVWRDDGDQLLDNAQQRSSQIMSRLLAMPWKHEAEIRMKGLAIAVKLDERYAANIEERARKRGMIVGAEDDTLELYPPLIISEDDVTEAFDILARCL
jgi:acetylornithine/succinyldiaminopimelate/putrescine aminotransferase